ncbi:phospholipid carrier-dependent glycosyltransferase [Corynebacterium sp. P7003]|uniref:Polyprenol-phosphate-mannose--protein mannosyltransferase n=1 Tax=Corynebacterium pygosceleis TaxID=2800406 RepID=A0ABT3WTQ8_9CORY|nr:phospholipid carrier-dependent glycosyltransferase [Corynebacterium pygosceleis]MCX7444334.1 phospholipid carrier-dependent glycosyltransferase [Corynebacterium pygosceleis]
MTDAPTSPPTTETGATPSTAEPTERRFRLPDPTGPATLPWTRTDTWTFLVIGILALLTRFFRLSFATGNGTPVFDEKHYVPQAWDMVRSAGNPVTGGIESNPGFGLVVHPPLAKQLLAYGEMIFGYTPLGWRLSTALFGVATVLTVMALTRRLTGSPVATAAAGVLALVEGVLLVSSRFGMLDIFQAFFVTAAAYCLARDLDQVWRRYHRAWADGTLREVSRGIGPRVGFRWWRFGCGILLGLTLSVKWSGLYYMAFFGVLTVCLDIWLRHHYRIARPFSGMLLRDAFPAFASIVIVPVLVYAWSWRAWFASETGVYRHSAVNGDIAPDSPLSALPDALAGWVYYHQRVLTFHASLTSSGGHSHPWDSKPWSWLAATRPILYFSETGLECGDDTCRRMIMLFGNPAVWWLTVPVVLWGIWCLVIRRDLRFAVPVTGFTAGWLPWLIAYDRQMYFFYATAMVPFTVVLLAITLAQIARTGGPARIRFPRVPFPRKLTTGGLGVICYLALTVTLFCYFLPIFYGFRITDDHFNSLMWLRSWK